MCIRDSTGTVDECIQGLRDKIVSMNNYMKIPNTLKEFSIVEEEFKEKLASIAEKDVYKIQPYLVPLNFGFERTEQGVTFYFHSAVAGRKVELLRRQPTVGFELDRCLLYTSRCV